MLVNNVPMMKGMKNVGGCFVGCIPASGLKDGRPIDTTICYIKHTDEQRESYKTFVVHNAKM